MLCFVCGFVDADWVSGDDVSGCLRSPLMMRSQPGKVAGSGEIGFGSRDQRHD